MPETPLRPVLALIAMISLGACASQPAATTAAASAAKKAPPIYDTMMLGEREITWKKNVCVQSNRRLFINLGTNDCAACRTANDAMTEEKFQRAFLRQFVPSYIDVSPGSPNLKLLEKWGIDPAKGLPIAVIFDEEGRLSEATQNGEFAREAGKGQEAVQLWILKRFYEFQ